MGRPSKKDTISLEALILLCERGFTDKEIAKIYKVSEVTVNSYKKNPEFLKSLKEGKEFADYLVEKSLYKRAMGFEYDEVTYEKSNTGGLGIKLKKGEVDEVKHVDTYKTKIVTKLIIPDVTAQIFWLKNRKAAEWRDKHEYEHTGDFIVKLGDKSGLLSETETEKLPPK